MNKKITLYHGSNRIIKVPQYGVGNPYNDYGMGFYCTQSLDLAKEWAVNDDCDGYANEYTLAMEDLSVLNMKQENYNILHWLTILLQNRLFDVQSDFGEEAKQYLIRYFDIQYQQYDVIIGYRADDSYFSYAKDFISGIISYEQLCKALMLGNLGEQICLKSKKAFESIRFTGYQKVDYNEWYPKKMARDMYARNGYKAMEKENYRKGELYITKIIDEELKADDLCI